MDKLILPRWVEGFFAPCWRTSVSIFLRKIQCVTLLFLVLGSALTASGNEGIVFSSPSGLYETPLNLGLSARRDGTRIFYTTNGELPNASSSKEYSVPLRVDHSTTLRALAWRKGRAVGDCVTRSYIFLSDVLTQNGNAFPSNWGTTNGVPVRAHYLMDPGIAEDSVREQMRSALKSIPMVSIVLPVADLFGTEHGIYAHPLESGSFWERAASFEFVSPDGQSSTQANCGLRIQGGWNRRPEESPKHAFRVVFRKKYGPGKLHGSIFGKDAGAEFDTLILRAGCNNSWLHWNGAERKRGEYLRDQWMRDTMREMGHASAAGLFVHLYLNGLYWGVYNLTERPDASFAAEHFGGKASDYDSMNADKMVEGDRLAWTELMSRINSGVTDGAALSWVAERLDLQNFIDYMLVNLYGANADWDRSSNWYAARRRNSGGKFRFFVWDAERTLENPRDDTISFDDDQSPPRIFHRLCENEQFSKMFRERAHKHLEAGGALSPERCALRYRRWSDAVKPAMFAEAARWGDYRRSFHQYKEGPYERYTRDEHWQPEVDRLLTEYFPQRSGVFAGQLKAHQIY